MPIGRPSSYRPEYAEQVFKLALLGATDVEIADFFHTSEVNLHRWVKAHPEFGKSRARGKLEADANVAHKTYRRALGYSHEAVKIFMPAGAATPVYAPYTEHFPPDTQAATWWLKNRQPNLWRDRQELTGAGGEPIAVAVEDKRGQARALLDATFSGVTIDGQADDITPQEPAGQSVRRARPQLPRKR